MNKPTVSIIIANYRGEQYLKACLHSIFREKGAYEVIIVDSNSPDKSVALIKKYQLTKSNLHLLELDVNKGPTLARNVGARKAKGNYLFFLDYDTTISPGWVLATKTFFEKNKKTACFQAKLIRRGTNNFDYAGDYLTPFGFLRERSRGTTDRGQFDRTEYIFSMKGAAMCVRKSVFKKIGGFDEDLEYMWEEPDLTWRMWMSGYEVRFNHTIRVEHAYVTEDKNKDYYRKGNVTYRGTRNSLSVILKNADKRTLLTMVIPNVLSLLTLSFLFIISGEFHRGTAMVKGTFWNISHIQNTIRKRGEVQKKRSITDNEIFTHVGVKNDLGYYLGKAVSYVRGKSF